MRVLQQTDLVKKVLVMRVASRIHPVKNNNWQVRKNKNRQVRKLVVMRVSIRIHTVKNNNQQVR